MGKGGDANVMRRSSPPRRLLIDVPTMQVLVDLDRFEDAIANFNKAEALQAGNYVSLGLLSNRALAYEGINKFEVSIAVLSDSLLGPLQIRIICCTATAAASFLSNRIFASIVPLINSTALPPWVLNIGCICLNYRRQRRKSTRGALSSRRSWGSQDHIF